MGDGKWRENWEQSNAPGQTKSPERRQVNISGDFVDKGKKLLH